MAYGHEPVMIREVLALLNEYLSNRDKPRIIDGTLGAGGYTSAIFEQLICPDSFVLGIDRDELAIQISLERLGNLDTRFEARQGKFGNISELAGEFAPFDAFVFDLGVSNMQITIPERGFSFQNDGPLDMRMNSRDGTMTAADVLEKMSRDELAKIFWDYGEERYARLIASGIKKNTHRIKTTGELVNLIRETLPQPVQRKMGTHPARRVFQALRIFVNDEVGELESMLARLPALASIERGAIVIVVSYHSIEDRLIKNTFKKWHNDKIGKIITRHPLRPCDDELERNYKSRSAKLRAFFLTYD